MNMQNKAITIIGAAALALPGLALAHPHNSDGGGSESMNKGSDSMHMHKGDPQSDVVKLEGTVLDIPAPEMSKGGFKFVTGGVGDVAQANMAAKYSNYSFKLVNVVSGAEAAYVADVHVMIWNEAGQMVLDTSIDGPWLIANMPAGTYKIKATFEGQTQTRTITLQEGANQRMVMDWRIQDPGM